MFERKRIVITGIGLTAPNGNNLNDFRNALLSGKSGVEKFETRYMGQVVAGTCDFDALKYQNKRELRRGTRAGSIAIYCANEAVGDAKIDMTSVDRSRIGIYVGTTEHGNVETENEIYNISKYGYDTQFWTHHHNPRTVSNNPAGEVTLNLDIKGPHYCIGAACAAGNLGLVQGYQMLQLEEVDCAIAGGVSESIHTFGIFAGFKSQVALGTHELPEKVSRPFDADRNGIVVSEGGCLYILETLAHAQQRGADKIYGEIVGYANNSDAVDFVLPDADTQAVCMQKALDFAGLQAQDIDILNAHATSTPMGDQQEAKAINKIFAASDNTFVNNTKGHIGHAMGAAGALELAGNLPSFQDNVIHPFLNLDNLDPECEVRNIVSPDPLKRVPIRYIMNNSFGMLGINSCLIVKKFEK